jgi:N-acyl-D-amino-acid deacylase
VRDEHVPGAAQAVTTDRRPVYARGIGLADRDREQAVQPAALFRIASVSKPITAVAVLKLIERGALAFDARVSDVLELPTGTGRAVRPAHGAGRASVVR